MNFSISAMDEDEAGEQCGHVEKQVPSHWVRAL